jgi:hypothetical protein
MYGGQIVKCVACHAKESGDAETSAVAVVWVIMNRGLGNVLVDMCGLHRAQASTALDSPTEKPKKGKKK